MTAATYHPAASPGTLPTASSRSASWTRVAMAVALLAASGGLRFWQRTRVDEALRSGARSLFPLETLPRTLGAWVGNDDDFDPQIARATGSVDRIFRTYHDTRTGVRLSVIVLYGPAIDMAVHTPENCYRAAGYGLADGPRARPIRLGEAATAFRALTFARGTEGRRDRQHVYYAWRFDERWSADLAVPKRLERIAGMYKVQVARAATEAERFDLVETVGADGAQRLMRDPCQEFLELMLPEIESRVRTSLGGALPPA